jgi:hypothetical protein
MSGANKKPVFLFLALLLPILIFLFLKFFGKNEFAVRPLFQDAAPEPQPGCQQVRIPYHIPDSVFHSLAFEHDSLVIVWFGDLKDAGNKQLRRVANELKNDRIRNQVVASNDQKMQAWRTCIFLLKKPYDVVLIDRRGLIRGQFVSDNREEIDRLITEVDIILKKY